MGTGVPMKAVHVIAALLLCSTLAVTAEGAGATPYPIPLSSVSMESDVYHVPSHPHSPSLIEIPCTLTVEKACMERVFVILNADIDVGWPVMVHPSKMVFINPRSQTFTVCVIVPPKVALSSANLTLTSFLKSPGLAILVTNTTCRIVPSPIFKSIVEPIGSHCVVGEGGSARFPIRILNTGTAEDVYTIDLSSDDLSLEDWKPHDGVTVHPGSYLEANLTVEYTEPERSGGIRHIDLQLMSGNSSNTGGNTSSYVGLPGSVELFLYFPRPIIGPFPGLSPLTVVLLIQLACLVSVLAAYFHRRRS
jgi:hypothetical protein